MSQLRPSILIHFVGWGAVTLLAFAAFTIAADYITTHPEQFRDDLQATLATDVEVVSPGGNPSMLLPPALGMANGTGPLRVGCVSALWRYEPSEAFLPPGMGEVSFSRF